MNKKGLDVTIIVCLFAAAALIVYLMAAPVWPLWRYQLMTTKNLLPQAAREIIEASPAAQAPIDAPDQLFIPSIGVQALISSAAIESQGLNEGVWRLPQSATPDGPGRVVITGHRFKYLPPNNTTFYLLDKLQAHDVVGIIWQGRKYYYTVVSRRVVDADDTSVLAPTADRVLTLFTCEPIFSEKYRLVIEAEPLEL